jgi:glc operon protein GlcG
MSDTFEKQSISSELAAALLRRAEERAAEIGVPSVIAIVDESGILKVFSRMDGAGLASVQVAKDKAYSAAATSVATDQWHGIAQADPSFGFGLAGIERLCPIGGGLPVSAGGVVVGGIGVSGGTVEQDIDVASAALALVTA